VPRKREVDPSAQLDSKRTRRNRESHAPVPAGGLRPVLQIRLTTLGVGFTGQHELLGWKRPLYQRDR
jgi:hypothetical protein